MTAKKIRWSRLDALGTIRTSGSDALAFLQGQLSNDVGLLSDTRAQLSSYNSPKGRMLAVLTLFRTGDTIQLELHRSVLESVLKRLRMFVLRSKVTLDDISAALPALGLWGDDASHVLSSLGLVCPAQALDVASHDSITVIRRLGESARYSLRGPAPAISKLETELAALSAPATEDEWKRADIEAGVPTVYPQTQDHFVPQWCNLHNLGGISFTKGCYTGQEIVARIHYLGEVKRRMQIFRLTACTGLIPGTQTEHGELVDSVALPEGGCLNLIVQRV